MRDNYNSIPLPNLVHYSWFHKMLEFKHKAVPFSLHVQHDKDRDTSFVRVVINGSALWKWSTLICFLNCPTVSIPCYTQWYIALHERETSIPTQQWDPHVPLVHSFDSSIDGLDYLLMVLIIQMCPFKSSTFKVKKLVGQPCLFAGCKNLSVIPCHTGQNHDQQSEKAFSFLLCMFKGCINISDPSSWTRALNIMGMRRVTHQ